MWKVLNENIMFSKRKFNDIDDDVTMWHDDDIYINIFIYMMTHTMRFLPWFFDDGLDVVLQAPLWTDLYRGRAMPGLSI